MLASIPHTPNIPLLPLPLPPQYAANLSIPFKYGDSFQLGFIYCRMASNHRTPPPVPPPPPPPAEAAQLAARPEALAPHRKPQPDRPATPPLHP